MKLFFQENTVENVVSKMLVILLKLFVSCWKKCLNVACLALTCKTETHREPVFSVAWCCQSHRMGHWQHPNLKMEMMMNALPEIIPIVLHKFVRSCCSYCVWYLWHLKWWLYFRWPGWFEWCNRRRLECRDDGGIRAGRPSDEHGRGGGQWCPGDGPQYGSVWGGRAERGEW